MTSFTSARLSNRKEGKDQKFTLETSFLRVSVIATILFTVANFIVISHDLQQKQNGVSGLNFQTKKAAVNVTSHVIQLTADNAEDSFEGNLMLKITKQTGFKTSTESVDKINSSSQLPQKDLNLRSHESDTFQFQYDNPLHKFPLPEWLDDFLNSQPTNTHNETLADKHEKFIVMTCHKYHGTYDEACGGFADRMTLLPYYIWLARKTGRRLLIKYSKPFPLEEFLVPPEGGFDWRLPKEYVEEEWFNYTQVSQTDYKKARLRHWHKVIESPQYINTRFVFVNNNLAIPFLRDIFTQETGEDLDVLWPGIFRRLFKPSDALGEYIDAFAREKGLVPGEYVAAHVRALWFAGPKHTMKLNRHRNEYSGLNMDHNATRNMAFEIADNSIKCAVKAMPEAKHVYFASDTIGINNYLLHESLKWSQPNITTAKCTSIIKENPSSPTISLVMRPNCDKPAYHLESSRNGHKPADYYSTFFELWIMAHSKCMAHGVGGYGRFGSVLSGNFFSCRVLHRHYINDGSPIASCPEALEMEIMEAEAEKLQVREKLELSEAVLNRAKDEQNESSK